MAVIGFNELSRRDSCRFPSLTLLILGLMTGSCSAAAVHPRVAISTSGRRNHARLLSEMDDTSARRIEAFTERMDGRSGTNSTIQLEDGDVVMCVPIKDQLSLIHISNPDFQLKPSTKPHDTQPRSIAYPWIQIAAQSYFLEGNVCSPGTYPLKSTRVPFARAAPSEVIDQFGNQHGTLKLNFVHEHAVAYLEGEFKGTEVNLNVWSPYVDKQSEFSLAQVWLVAVDNFTTNSIEAGWQVYEGQYGDRRPRLFTYWTADNYNKTGCYNLDCPGFVQVSNRVLLGGAFKRTSTANWIQYEVRLQIFQDPETHNWWLKVNNEHAGYWPSTLFTNSLRDRGTDMLQWGGEVLGNEQEMGHTNTRMGSGEFPGAGFRRAAYLRQVKYVSDHHELWDATDMRMGAEAPNCYSSDAPVYDLYGDEVVTRQTYMPFKKWGAHFFFGGPGRSSDCSGN